MVVKDLQLEEILFSRKIQALYRAIPSSIFATIMIAAVMVTVLWNVMDQTALITWLVIIIAINLGRYFSSLVYHKHSDREENLELWDRIFFAGMTLNALAWGGVSIWLLPDNQSVYHYFPALILIGMSAGAVTTLSFKLTNIITYYLLVLGPLFVVEVLTGTWIAYSVAFLIIIFMIFSLSSARRINQTITQNIILQYETEKHRDELIASRNEALASNSAKTRFISMISHELRTPLNGILGFAQLLKMSDEPELNNEQQDHTNGIIDSGKHLLKLIEQMLELSKMESTKISINMEEVQLLQLLDEVLNIINPVALEHDISIINDIQHDYLVKADSVRLKQVLINLLTNAVKYNAEGGEVYIGADELDNDILRIKVIDDGKGLDEEQQKKIFDPFQRYNEVKEGLGLGLYICKTIMEHMEGSIGVESEPGKGCIFWIDVKKVNAD